METKLENGVTILVKENHAAPLVTADIWVRTGSADEPHELNGVSHFLEHMVFKGSERLGVGDFDRRVENMGGYLNAATSKDFTHYYTTVPSRHFQSAFHDLADVVANASLTPEEFEKERSVILEEIRRKQDSPTGYLYETLFAETFGEGVYKRPVLGSPETIQAMTQEAMFRYHRTRYAPENLIVVVVGDIEAAAVVEEVRSQLGHLEANPASDLGKSAAPPPETEYVWGLRKEYKKDVREVYLMIAFPAPGIGDKDDPDPYALDLATTILGGSRASRLWRTVREERRLVSSVSMSYVSLRDDCLVVVSATLEAEKVEETIEAIHEEVKRFIQQGPTAAEMARSRKSIANHFLFQNETNAGQSNTLGYFYTLTGDSQYAERYLDHLNRMKGSSVKKAAKHYLDRSCSNVFLVLPPM